MHATFNETGDTGNDVSIDFTALLVCIHELFSVLYPETVQISSRSIPGTGSKLQFTDVHRYYHSGTNPSTQKKISP